MSAILTVGHSNHSIETFLGLLDGAGVTAVADVRSTPKSRWTPHFNADVLQASLKAGGIAYAFLGVELGGRPEDEGLYAGDTADYEAMARTDSFRRGIDRVLDGGTRHRVALMCTEKEPLDCHRCLLVARKLAEQGATVEHVHADGHKESQTELEERLLGLVHKSVDMFSPRDEQLASAYRTRGLRVAYKRTGSAPGAR
jgi:Uncharacterized conserved protein